MIAKGPGYGINVNGNVESNVANAINIGGSVTSTSNNAINIGSSNTATNAIQGNVYVKGSVDGSV